VAKQHKHNILNQADYRDRLAFEAAVKQLEKAERQVLRQLTAEEQSNIVDENGAILMVPARVDAGRVAAARALMESAWKKINKHLPDAKQGVDITSNGESIGADARPMTALEALNRLNYLRTMAAEEEDKPLTFLQ
jgi:hypothetical protein